MDDALFAARKILETETPLLKDCGRICGARCCSSLEGEETGMLLFPGEEAYYEGRAGWRILQAGEGGLLICPGSCEREERPLSCRLFPLLPLISEGGGIRVVTDRRARAVCPLARQGKSAMSPGFVRAVREAGEALAADGRQKRFLETLAAEQEELKQLSRMLGGEHHV